MPRLAHCMGGRRREMEEADSSKDATVEEALPAGCRASRVHLAWLAWLRSEFGEILPESTCRPMCTNLQPLRSSLGTAHKDSQRSSLSYMLVLEYIDINVYMLSAKIDLNIIVLIEVVYYYYRTLILIYQFSLSRRSTQT